MSPIPPPPPPQKPCDHHYAEANKPPGLGLDETRLFCRKCGEVRIINWTDGASHGGKEALMFKHWLLVIREFVEMIDKQAPPGFILTHGGANAKDLWVYQNALDIVLQYSPEYLSPMRATPTP